MCPEARKADSILRCMTRSMARRSREGIIQNTASSFGTLDTGWQAGVGLAKGPQDGQGLEHLAYEESLREMGLSSLGKGRPRGTALQLASTYKEVMENTEPDSEPWCMLRRQNNECKVIEKRFSLEIRKTFFSMHSLHQTWNYRPVSLTLIPGNMMEQLILATISKHMNSKKIIRSSQHGFTKGKSYKRRAVVIVCFDFCKAFHAVCHKILMDKSVEVWAE
ncbi:hypothetical protein QYF61_027688 [Mycteria americana]|uniref:Reverse transcriptase n=1 Tax=Mycteria americana TaxID=33587 RepID=A0AAN7RJL6_MYCAM|nr:hypothetical protein QYF61_027688 [Mycteria americana]